MIVREQAQGFKVAPHSSLKKNLHAEEQASHRGFR